MRKRNMIIRDSVTPDPIDFYMEIKENKTIVKDTLSKWTMKKTAAARISLWIDPDRSGAGTADGEAC